MGEAKRRRAAGATTDVVAVDHDKIAQALRVAMAPVSELRGGFAADCVLYASVGAEALRALGLPARMLAGDAVWRVGPGDADVIHHVAGAGTPTYGPANTATGAFHAWIGIASHGAAFTQLVDFTTWQLREKGRLLDQADGGNTIVEFCPDYLWVPERHARSMTLRQVTESFTPGVYAYASRPRVEGMTLPSEAAVGMMAEVALFCYSEILAGRSPVARLVSSP